MIWSTHLAGGVQAGLAMVAITNPEPHLAAIEIGSAMLGSVLPDIDKPGSKITQKDYGLSLVSKAISKFTKHRRATHTIWAAFLFGLFFFFLLKIATVETITGASVALGLLVAILLDFLDLKIGIFAGIITFYVVPYLDVIPQIKIDSNVALICGIGITAGCLVHMLYDTFNPQGIMWLHPYSKKRYHLMNIQVMSSSEKFFRVLMWFVVLAMLVVLSTTIFI